MATVTKEIALEAPPEVVWAAVRDVGAVHRRLAPGFVTDTRLDGDARVVTFADGRVARELIVTVDDAARRLAYASVGGRATHHHASMQVVADGVRPGDARPDGATRSRLVWVTDVLPDTLAEPIRAAVEHGAAVMQRTLNGAPPPGVGSPTTPGD